MYHWVYTSEHIIIFVTICVARASSTYHYHAYIFISFFTTVHSLFIIVSLHIHYQHHHTALIGCIIFNISSSFTLFFNSSLLHLCFKPQSSQAYCSYHGVGIIIMRLHYSLNIYHSIHIHCIHTSSKVFSHARFCQCTELQAHAKSPQDFSHAHIIGLFMSNVSLFTVNCPSQSIIICQSCQVILPITVKNISIIVRAIYAIVL